MMLDRQPVLNRVHNARTPLLLSINYDNVEVMIDLLKAGADPNLKVGGWSALYYARRVDDTHVKKEMLRALIHYGADIAQAGNVSGGSSAADLFLLQPPEVYCIVLPEHDTCR
jgi:ankyrin repeat protein